MRCAAPSADLFQHIVLVCTRSCTLLYAYAPLLVCARCAKAALSCRLVLPLKHARVRMCLAPDHQEQLEREFRKRRVHQGGTRGQVRVDVQLGRHLWAPLHRWRPVAVL